MRSWRRTGLLALSTAVASFAATLAALIALDVRRAHHQWRNHVAQGV